VCGRFPRCEVVPVIPVAHCDMLSSPLLSELVRTLGSVPDPAGGLGTVIRGVRVAEADLRLALDDLQESPSQLERTICVARRNQAMRELIGALQALHRLLEHDSNCSRSDHVQPPIVHSNQRFP
ncbi:MAG: hypothetical protein ABIW79_02465, partial [Gemmatimonas sp.]